MLTYICIYIQILVTTFCYIQYKYQQTDYIQGIEFNIIHIHLPAAILSYIIITILIFLYTLEMLHFKNEYYSKVLNTIGIINTSIILCSGYIWSWTQWGLLLSLDLKSIIITTTLIIHVVTPYIIDTPIRFIYIFVLLICLTFNTPILQYNNTWSSEVHQQKSVSVIELFVHNNTTIIISISAMLLVFTYIYIGYLDIQYKRIEKSINYYSNN